VHLVAAADIGRRAGQQALSQSVHTYEPNDLQRRRQVLDQMTMRILPNGYVRRHADH